MAISSGKTLSIDLSFLENILNSNQTKIDITYTLVSRVHGLIVATRYYQ